MTRRRVALVSSCAPPLPGHPVTGGGLRTAQLLATLAVGKHAVQPMIERAALPDDAPNALRAFSFGPGELADVVRRARPEVLVVEQWALVDQLGGIDLPLVLDLHGSLLLENVYRRGRLDLVLDAKSKLDALHRADLLLAPASAQLHHFASWATLAGFDPRELPLALLPLAPSTPVAPPRTATEPSLSLVYAGARWPWIDSLPALSGVAEVLPDLAGATLQIATFDPPRHGLPFEEDLGTWPELLTQLARRPGVTLHDGLSHAETSALLARSTVALDLWTPNAERLLAATTRTMEFLAAGLPVVTVSGAAWAEDLLSFGAGWTVPPGDAEALRVLLRSLAADPARVATASRHASRLASTRGVLAQSGAALLDFVHSPRRSLRATPLVTAIVEVRQAHLNESLRSHEAAHRGEHQRLVAEHKAETVALRQGHAAETAALRERAQAELEEARRERKAEVARLAKEHQEELADRATTQSRTLSEREIAERDRAEASRAEHRAEVEAMAHAQREALQALSAEGRAERERGRAEADERLRHAEHEAERERERFESQLAQANEAAQSARAAQAAAHKQELAEAVAEHRHETQRLVAMQRSEALAQTAAHKQELAEAVAEHRTATEQLAALQRSEALAQTAAHQKELAGAVTSHRRATDELAATHRRDMERLVSTHRDEALTQAAAHKQELTEAVAAHRSEMERIAAHHRHEFLAHSDAADARLAGTEAARLALQESLTLRVQELATAQDRWKVDRARDKEERVRIDVERRADGERRAEELRKEAATRLAEQRREAEGKAAQAEAKAAQLQAQIDQASATVSTLNARLEAFESRKALRILDALHAVALPRPTPTRTGRIAPAARLARLLVEHAFDRERD